MADQFRISATGLRAWAKDIRDKADDKARKLERMADELDAENSQTWPQSGEERRARKLERT